MRLTIVGMALVAVAAAHAEPTHHTLIDFRSPSGICASLADAANYEDVTENNRINHVDENDLRFPPDTSDKIRQIFYRCMATVAPTSTIDPIPTFDTRELCSIATSNNKDLADCLDEEKKDKESVSLLWNSIDSYGRAECMLIIGKTQMPYMMLNVCLEGARDHKF